MSSPEIPTGGDAITAEWLRRALIAGGASDAAAIEEVIVEDIGAGVGLLGEILRCRLVCRDAAASIPATVIVKLPSQESKSGVVARIVTGPHDANRQDPHVPMRYDTGRPRAVIRFRISQPRTASLPCPAGLRARRPSPMMDL